MSAEPFLAGFRFLGWGPEATSGSSAWDGRPEMYGRCGRCAGLVGLWRAGIESCLCGALRVDHGNVTYLDDEESIPVYSRES